MRAGVDQDLIIMLRDHLHWSEEHQKVGRLTVPFEQQVANVSKYNPEIGMAEEGSAFGLLSNFMFWPDAMGTGSAKNTRLPRPTADPYDYVPGFMPAMPSISRIKAKAGEGTAGGTVTGKAIPVRDTNLRPDQVYADIKILGLQLDPFAPAKKTNATKSKLASAAPGSPPQVTKLVPGSSSAILPGIFDLNNEEQTGGLYSSPIAGGLPILWVAAAERQMLYNLGMPTWANVLVSDWSSEAANDLFFSTRLADLSGTGTVDYDRISTLASILRSTPIAKKRGKQDPRFGVALVGGYAPNDPMVGRGMMTYDGFLPSGSMSFPSGPAGQPEMITYISGSGGGPVTGGAGLGDKHLIAIDDDGVPHVQGHLDLRSPWYFNQGFDAPPEHSGLWDNNCNEDGVWNLTVLRFDPEAGPHAGAGPEFSLRSIYGMHRWQTKTLVHIPKDKGEDGDPKKKKKKEKKKPTGTPKGGKTPTAPGSGDGSDPVDPGVSPIPGTPSAEPFEPYEGVPPEWLLPEGTPTGKTEPSVPVGPELVDPDTVDEDFLERYDRYRRRRAREKVIEEWWKKRPKRETPQEPKEPSTPLWGPIGEGADDVVVDVPIYPTPDSSGLDPYIDEFEGTVVNLPGAIGADGLPYGPSADSKPDPDPFDTRPVSPGDMTGYYPLEPADLGPEVVSLPLDTPLPPGGSFVVDGEGRLIGPSDIWVHPVGGGAVVDAEGRYIRPLDIDELDEVTRGKEVISEEIVSNVDSYARIWMNLSVPGMLFSPPLLQGVYGSDSQYDRNPDSETLQIIENTAPSAYLAPFGKQVGGIMETDDSAGSGALWAPGFTTGGVCLYPPTHGLDERILDNPNCPDTSFVMFSGTACRSKLAWGTPNQVGSNAGKVTDGWQMWSDGVSPVVGKLYLDYLSSTGAATNATYWQGPNQYLTGSLFASSVAVKSGSFYNTVNTETLTGNKRASLRDRNMTVGAHLVDASVSGTVAAATLHSLRCDTSSAVVTINLPAISSANAGDELEIIDASGNASTYAITINRAGGDMIRGGTSYVINTDYAVVRLRSDGVGVWHVTSEVTT